MDCKRDTSPAQQQRIPCVRPSATLIPASVLAGATVLGLLLGTAGTLEGQTVASWPFAGQNLSNTRSAGSESILSPATVGGLTLRWTFNTTDDVSATPSVDGTIQAVYFPDWGGYLYKVDATTGRLIWSHSMSEYGMPAGALSRTTPALAGNLIITTASSALGLQEHYSAKVLGLDAGTGSLVWSQQPDPSIYALLTASPVVANGVVYVGTSSAEEALSTPTFRGSVIAYDLATGTQLWQTYMAPAGYTGNAIWSSTPVVDLKRGSLYVTTGNNYTVPASVQTCEQNFLGSPKLVLACQSPANYVDAVVALDLATGAVKWARRLSSTDAWLALCGMGVPGCPKPKGPDYDFGSGANLFTAVINGQATDLVGAGQKSGVYWALDADNGAVVWSRRIGPGGMIGGIQWGTAVDGQRIYAAESNSGHAAYDLPGYPGWTGGSWAALDPATGSILWQVPDPGLSPVDPSVPAMALGPVTAANGVVYAASMSGILYAMDASTGQVLWAYDTGASVNAAPAIVNGWAYWGSGYHHFGAWRGVPRRNWKHEALCVCAAVGFCAGPCGEPEPALVSSGSDTATPRRSGADRHSACRQKSRCCPTGSGG